MSSSITPSGTRPSVAVVGSGVSGLTAAHVLARTHAVTLFEADERLGGHAHTHDVTTAAGSRVAVDSGFIVHNERTYPELLRLFAELGVQTRPTEMSMSITCRSCGLSYAGGRGVGGILAQPWRIADPRFVRLLTEVPRFHRAARALVANDGHELSWGEFLEQGGYSTHFIRHFAVPLVSCVWSSDDRDALSYPARHLFRFLDHHGMLSVSGSPTWRTVIGGSRTYVERLAARLPDIRRRTPVTAIARHDDGVDVTAAGGQVQTYDQVVLATHADDALGLLVDATAEEKRDLGSIRYSVNRATLHRDSSLLPSRKAARASWNHRTSCATDDAEPASVSYWMNRLQGLDTDEPLVVSLNSDESVEPSSVIARMTYHHPVFTPEAVAGAARLRSSGGDRLTFAGAYLGWGFHEDGCRSGVEAAARLGATG